MRGKTLSGKQKGTNHLSIGGNGHVRCYPGFDFSSRFYNPLGGCRIRRAMKGGKRPAAAAAVAAATDEEVAFPRGGASALTPLERRQAEHEVLLAFALALALQALSVAFTIGHACTARCRPSKPC